MEVKYVKLVIPYEKKILHVFQSCKAILSFHVVIHLLLFVSLLCVLNTVQLYLCIHNGKLQHVLNIHNHQSNHQYSHVNCSLTSMFLFIYWWYLLGHKPSTIVWLYTQDCNPGPHPSSSGPSGISRRHLIQCIRKVSGVSGKGTIGFLSGLYSDIVSAVKH